MASAPSFTQDELASDEGCTDLHKRKLRWIAHIFDKGWEIGRIQDEKAPRGHKYVQANIKLDLCPSDGSTWFHVLHPAQYGPDGSWVFVVPPPTNPRRSSRPKWETGEAGSTWASSQWEAGSVADAHMPTAPGWQTPLR